MFDANNRADVDSREGFTAEEYDAYMMGGDISDDDPTYAEGDSCPLDWDLFDEMSESDDDFDGQPSEYDEWQDYYGGDDWDHGQFDEY